MSDHPEVPRIEFYGDGYSMNVEQAVDRFRSMLTDYTKQMNESGLDNWGFSVEVEIRSCDCDSDIRGRDDGCPLHGDPTIFKGDDGYGDDDAIHALPEWCSTGTCGDPRCHRDKPRAGCTEHRKCRDRYEA
jgi:hypothetical protein